MPTLYPNYLEVYEYSIWACPDGHIKQLAPLEVGELIYCYAVTDRKTLDKICGKRMHRKITLQRQRIDEIN